VRELAKQQPQNAALQYMLGKLLARKGDWQDAIGPLANAAQGMPNSAEVHAFLGTVYQYTGQSAEALPPYKRAVELAPTNLEYRSTYGLLLGLNDQCAEAEAELIKVTSSADYKGAGGWVNLGWVYRNCGTKPKAAEAATAYERALKLDPRSAPAAVGLGWALLLAGRYDESIPAFNKSMELEKANAIQAHNGIAWNHYFKKEMAQAKVALERARTAGHADRNLEDAIKNFETRGEQDVERDKEKIKQPDRNASDLDSLGGKLVSGGAGAAASAGQLVKFGKPAVQYLVWAAVNAPDIGVRRASVRALGQIGAAAQSTCPQLKAIAVLPPVGGLIQTNQEMEYNLALGDLRRDAKEASAKIGCR
jgi:Flp pilus assembly protein TadD